MSDNGTQFKSAQFEEFMIQNGIKHFCSSPYYPMSNGQAERFVDTFKRSLGKLKDEGTVEENLNTFLLNYRSTGNPNTPENKSPAEVIFGRKMRITLDILKPPKQNTNLPLDVEQKVCQQFNMKHGAKLRIFGEQDNVYARVYKGNNQFCWSPGIIIERVGNVIYNVLLNSGRLIRVHANQLRTRHNTDKNVIEKDWSHALDVYEGPNSTTEIQDAANTAVNNLPEANTAVLPSTISDVNTEIAQTSTPRRSQRPRRPVKRFSPS